MLGVPSLTDGGWTTVAGVSGRRLGVGDKNREAMGNRSSDSRGDSTRA